MDRVIDFYRSRLPHAAEKPEEGGVAFTFVPTGAEEGEHVWVVVTPEKLHIGESVKPGKKAR